MGVEKHGSKSGNYVGGFLQLFDWNAKSRKKLFSSKSDLPEKFKQQKRFDGNLPTTRLQMLDEDEVAAARPSMKGSSDHSCASSVMEEDSNGSRGPGVVARLMGLDSLPKSNASDHSFSTPLSDSQSLPGSFYRSKNLDYCQDPQIMNSSRLQKLGLGPNMEPSYQKVIQTPMEKFQTEVLPPRSAKAIPVTHHKLLSPIKSTSFIPTKDAVHIMEAAARILEPSPQVSRKPVLPLAASSSVPLKVRDLKEKVQEAQKPSKPSDGFQRSGETRGVKHPRGSSVNKSSNSGSVDAMSVRSNQDSVEVSSGVRSKGKSVSLALQAKANVQKRESLNAISSKTCPSQAEASDLSPKMLFTSQSGTQKSTLKKSSTQKSSNVLRQNNQKQNCIVDRGKLPLKSNSLGGKAVSGDGTSARRQNSGKLAGASKVSSRKLDAEAKDDKSNASACSSERVTRKKRSIEGNYHSDSSQASHNPRRDKNGKVIHSTASVNSQSSWGPDSGKEGTDVISFTFTAPMRSTQFQENSRIFSIDSPSKRIMLNSNGMTTSKFSFLGQNIKGSDSLSTFLELQLKELAHKVESSQQNSGAVSLKSSSMLGDHDMKDANYSNDTVGQPGSSLYSRDQKGFIADETFEAMLQGKGISGLNITEERSFISCRLPSPASVLEHSSFTESCNSSDSADYHGSNKCSSAEYENSYSIDTFLPCEGDAELSDTVSSTSAATMAKTRDTTLTLFKYGKPRSLELEYVKEMLCNIDLMFDDYTMGRTAEFINPHLFYQLESCSKKNYAGCGLASSTDRRLMFDCVAECVDMKCRQYGAGGYKLWAKGVRVVKRKERVAEDVLKEISSWRGMGDFMVDELVDRDMSSSLQGRWLDYGIEEFEVGMQIESRILNSLIDDVVADILVNL